MKFLILISCFFVAKARANYYLEPYVGKSVNYFNQDITNISGTFGGVNYTNGKLALNGTIDGTNLGVRTYNKYFDQIIFGSDVNIGLSKGTVYSGPFTILGQFNFTTISPGIIFGWDVPTSFFPRIWAGYYPIDALNLSQNESASDKYTGSSSKFGFSFDWWIQLSFEYSSHEFNKINGHTFPYTYTVNSLTLTEQKVKYEEYVISISYPFSIETP